MYHTLTLVDNQAVKQIPEKLSRLLQQILSASFPKIRQSELSTYHYADEQHCDLLILLNYFFRVKKQNQSEFDEFSNFVRSSVIASYRAGGEFYGPQSFRDPWMEKLCGLSLYLPETEPATSCYSSLALYQNVDLVKFYKTILSNTIADLA